MTRKIQPFTMYELDALDEKQLRLSYNALQNAYEEQSEHNRAMKQWIKLQTNPRPLVVEDGPEHVRLRAELEEQLNLTAGLLRENVRMRPVYVAAKRWRHNTEAAWSLDALADAVDAALASETTKGMHDLDAGEGARSAIVDEAKRSRNWMQDAVEQFHEKFGHVINYTPTLSRTELRAKLIEEEAKETVDAIRRGDFVEAIDGMCDLLYVVFGTAVEFGIDIQPFFDEVHRTNMLKEGGATREDGKTLKPLGWEPPRIKQMLEELFAEMRRDT